MEEKNKKQEKEKELATQRTQKKDSALTSEQKQEIDKAVDKVVDDYGETLRLLGDL